MEIYHDRTGLMQASPYLVLIKDEGIGVMYNEDDAIPFIVYNGRVEFGMYGTEHQDIYAHLRMSRRTVATLEGRYWKDRNVLSFWHDRGTQSETLAADVYSNIDLIYSSFKRRLGFNIANAKLCFEFSLPREIGGQVIVVMTPVELKRTKPTSPSGEFFYNMLMKASKTEEPQQNDDDYAPNGMSKKDYYRHYEMVGESKENTMSNNVINIEESQLKSMVGKMIRETYRRVMNEANLRDAVNSQVKKLVKEMMELDLKKGEIATNLGDTWRGVPGTRYIWHGEWADPEIEYKGYLINANDVEDFFYDRYMEGIQDQGFGTEGYDEAFDDWMNKQSKITLTLALDDMIAGGSAQPINEGK